MVFPPSPVGDIARPHLHEQATRQSAGRLRTRYEEHEFSVPVLADKLSLKGGLVDSVIDHSTSCTCLRANPAAFALCDRVQNVTIRHGGAVVLVVRFNDKTFDPVTISPGEILEWPYLEVVDVFFSNASGAAVIPVKVTLS